MFELVPEFAEKVLAEIISHTDQDYWKNRFLSVSIEEDQELREAFAILKQRNLIEAKWYDNYPAIRIIKAGGKTYFNDKAEYLEQQKKAKRKEMTHEVREWINTLKP